MNDWKISGCPIMLWVDYRNKDYVYTFRKPIPLDFVTNNNNGLYIKTAEPGHYKINYLTSLGTSTPNYI